MTGRAGEGTAIIEEALTRSNSSGVRWHAAELMRVGAELRLAGAGDSQMPEGATQLRAALDVARDQGALFWELRAALISAGPEAWLGWARAGLTAAVRLPPCQLNRGLMLPGLLRSARRRTKPVGAGRTCSSRGPRRPLGPGPAWLMPACPSRGSPGPGRA